MMMSKQIYIGDVVTWIGAGKVARLDGREGKRCTATVVAIEGDGVSVQIPSSICCRARVPFKSILNVRRLMRTANRWYSSAHMIHVYKFNDYWYGHVEW